MDKLNCFTPNGYNMCNVAGTALGLKRSDDCKRKISLSRLGKKISDEAKIKMSKAKLGKKQTLEHRQNVSKALKGVIRGPISNERKLILSITHKGHIHF